MINSHIVYVQQDYAFGCVGAYVIKKNYTLHLTG